MADPLTWQNVSTPNLRDFAGYDGDRDVARICFDRSGPNEGVRRWSVYVVVPARRGVSNGAEVEPKEAPRKVEECWAFAKASGRPTRTAVAEHVYMDEWAPKAQRQS